MATAQTYLLGSGPIFQLPTVHLSHVAQLAHLGAIYFNNVLLEKMRKIYIDIWIFDFLNIGSSD
jgi:hypothetical protein